MTTREPSYAEVEQFIAAHPTGATHAEVGAVWGVSRQYIRQLEVRALRKLRDRMLPVPAAVTLDTGVDTATADPIDGAIARARTAELAIGTGAMSGTARALACRLGIAEQLATALRARHLDVQPNYSSTGADAPPKGPPRIDLPPRRGGASARTLDHKNQRPGQRNHSASRGAGPGHRRLLVHANSTAAFRGGNR